MPRVLIIDDCVDFRLSLGAQLQRSGHNVSFADNGWEAVGQLKKEPVDLVLLDYHMPVCGGIESITLFRQENLNHPVIAYTCKDPYSASPFESVMGGLGTVATVRVADNTEVLMRKVETFFNRDIVESEPDGYPVTLNWDDVRMLNIEPLAVSIVLKDQPEPLSYTFQCREQMELVLARWFRNRPPL